MSSFFSSPFKGHNPIKGLGNTLKSFSEYVSTPGFSSIKAFRSAVLDGNEDKALEIYLSINKGQCLRDLLQPSEAFPIQKYSDQTPLHLAAQSALKSLVMKLIGLGGTPSLTNGKGQTSLHSLCSQGDKQSIRDELVLLFLRWEGFEADGIVECVSINHVDSDGNTALHLACLNNLTGCIALLISHGAIISIVNKDQRNCCELADLSGYQDLAHTVELAILYQPEDDLMMAYNQENRFLYEDKSPVFILDTWSMTPEELKVWILSTISELSSEIMLPKYRVEALLDFYSWDVETLRSLCRSDLNGTLKKANMAECSTKLENFEKLVMDRNIDPGNLGALFSKIDNGTISENPLLCEICQEEMISVLSPKDFIENEEVILKSVICPAGHKFCLGCWRMQLQMHVREHTAKSLQCPAYKCGERLDTQEWENIILVDKELIEVLRSSRLSYVTDCSEQLRGCPHPECGLTLCMECIPTAIGSSSGGSGRSQSSDSRVNLTKSVVCSNGHSYCLSCFQSAHPPYSCELAKEWSNKVREQLKHVDGESASSDIANALWLAANCKRCPRCQTPIEKDEGCNHMSCRKCRYEFCWICMQNWSLHSNNTGGYFQCNRFIDSESSDKQADILRSRKEESGNAHMETARMQAQGRNMAKFIHYYTRYRAHGESFTLENRIRKETILRIKIALQRSYKGDIEWLQEGSTNHPYRDLTIEEAKSLNLGDFEIANLKRFYPDVTDLTKSPSAGNVFSLKSMFRRSTEFSKSSTGGSETTLEFSDLDPEILKKLHVSKTDPLLFLFNGFRELLCCRLFLQGSFVYGFYFFERHDVSEDDESHWQGYMEQSLYMSRKQSYEQLQADLESLVEMLSDVVARKRLRASKAQIEQATSAARSKRIEFEFFIQNTEKALVDSNAAYETRSLRSSISTPSSNRRSRNRLEQRSPGTASSRSNSRIGEDSDSFAIMELLSEMRRNPVQPDQAQAIAQLQAAEERIRRYREVRSSSFSPPVMPDRGNSAFMNRLDSASGASPTKFISPGKHLAAPSYEKIAIDNNDDASLAIKEVTTVDDDEDAYLNQAIQQIQLEEEAELNRAIFLSLQQSEPATILVSQSETEERGTTVIEDAFPSESNISVLVSMGFSQDQAQIALTNHNDNLEHALNELCS